MRNRLYLMAMVIVVGLVYLINAQEKAPDLPAAGEPAKPAVTVLPAPAIEPAPAPAKEPATLAKEAVAVTEAKPVEAKPAEMAPVKPAEVTPATPAPAAEAVTEKPAEQKAPAAPEAAKTPVPAPAAPETVVKVMPATNVAEFVALPEQKDKDMTGLVQQKTNDTLSIALDEVEMADVIRMFTKLSKANIIANPSNLVGKVTVNLQDVEWKPALTSILDMHGLGLVEKIPASGVFSIVPKPAGAPEPLVVETMFLKYASVSNVESVVKAMAPAPGSVSSFASRNALVIRATTAQMSEIKETLKKIATMREQVFIEAKFMELNDEAIKDLGINWQVLQGYNLSAGNLKMDLTEDRNWNNSKSDTVKQWDKRNNVDSLDKRYGMDGLQYEDITHAYTVVPTTPPTTQDQITRIPVRQVSDIIDKGKEVSAEAANTFVKSAADVRTAVLGASDFQVILSALKQMSGVSVVSNPKIMVANEEPAIIHIGQEERPFVSSVTPGQQGIAPVITYNPGQPVQIGVKLTVTPTVNTESNITVKIEPELTRVLKDAVAPNGQTYPIVAKKTIKTVFCLESGKTVAIGGLTETGDRDDTTKIPLLGDIPLIGKYLFSHTHKEKSQSETIIFVTVGLAIPEAVEAETGMPEDTELAQRKLMEIKLKKYKSRKDLEKQKTDVEATLNADSEKAKSRLMRMSK